MEDISRELEREIARSRPSPHKKSGKKRILIVDDLGGIRSGGHLKYFLVFFLSATLVCLAVAGIFFIFFNKFSGENKELAYRVASLENQVQSLTHEKEILMARLVMSGKDPAIAPEESDKAPGAAPEPVTVAGENQKKPDTRADKDEGGTEDTEDMDAVSPVPQQDAVEDQAQKDKSGIPVVADQAGKVDIEKFSVTRDRDQGDLLVRFDIRNVSEKPGEVSGHIFTILKPEDRSKNKNQGQDQWRVLPQSPLENGIPSQTKNGQYFSIAHFKPVKFRIKNVPGQAFFTTASIFIFNDQGELMFKSDIEIGEEDLG